MTDMAYPYSSTIVAHLYIISFNKSLYQLKMSSGSLHDYTIQPKTSNLCILGNLLLSADFSRLFFFKKKPFRNTIRVSNSLDLDQTLCWSWSGSELFAKVNHTKERVNLHFINGYSRCSKNVTIFTFSSQLNVWFFKSLILIMLGR